MAEITRQRSTTTESQRAYEALYQVAKNIRDRAQKIFSNELVIYRDGYFFSIYEIQKSHILRIIPYKKERLLVDVSNLALQNQIGAIIYNPKLIYFTRSELNQCAEALGIGSVLLSEEF